MRRALPRWIFDMPCPYGRIFFVKRGNEALQLETRDLGCARLKKKKHSQEWPRHLEPAARSCCFAVPARCVTRLYNLRPAGWLRLLARA
jgi:hypothetical protein